MLGKERPMTRVIACVLSALLLAATAEAHVSVRPRESRAGATEKYTVRVPTEGKVATTSVELEIPQGVTVNSVEPADSVKSEMKREGGRVVSITWTVTIDPGQNRELVFVATNSSDATEIVWKARQRYSDGTSSEWVGAPGSLRPASVTTVTPAAAGGRQ
jgi:uncharacterized protein YcnI